MLLHHFFEHVNGFSVCSKVPVLYMPVKDKIEPLFLIQARAHAMHTS